MKTSTLILTLLAAMLVSCQTSYQHPPVTTETDNAINAMMAH